MGNANAQMDAAATAIEKGELVAAIRPCFQSMEEALRFYATYQQVRYPYDVAPQKCVSCGRPEAEHRVAWLWQTEIFKEVGFGCLEAFLLFLGRLSVKLNQEVIAYQTVHPLCEACWRKLKRGHRLAKLLDGVVLFGIIVGLFVGGSGFGGVFVLNHKPGEWVYWFLTGLVGCALLGMAIATMKWARRLRTPTAVRGLGGGRFRCSDAMLVGEAAP